MKADSPDMKRLTAYEESVSGFLFENKALIFKKMLAYVEKGNGDPQDHEIKPYLHRPPKEEKSPSLVNPKSINEVKEIPTGTYKSIQSVKKSTMNDLTPVNKTQPKPKPELMKTLQEYNLPARPLIKSLEDQAFILENFPMNREMCEALGSSLTEKGNLNTILLVNNKLNDEALAAFMEPIMSNPIELKVFRCINNSFGERFISVFEKKFFSFGANCLRELSLDGCQALEKSVIDIITTLIGVRSRLKYLSLANIGLDESSIKSLGRFLVNSEYLISLDVSWNKMNSNTTRILLENVKINQSLKHLDLSWNSLSHPDNKNAKILKDIIINSPNLIHLNISYTRLNDLDGVLIIEGVKANQNIMAVHLGGNFINALVVTRMSYFLNSQKKDMCVLPPFQDSFRNRIYNKLHNGVQCK